MSDEYYVIITNQGYWGTGKHWREAAKNANALSRGKLKKKDMEIIGFHIVVSNPLTQEQVDYIKERFSGTEDLKAGDLCTPLFTFDGGIEIYGASSFEKFKPFTDLDAKLGTGIQLVKD